MRYLSLALVLLCFVIPHKVHAAAAVAQRQQAQQQAQYEAVQQAVAQQQAQQIAEYQQAQAQAQAQAQMYAQAQAQVQAQINAQVAAYVQQAQIKAAQEQMLKQAVEQELIRRARDLQNQQVTEVMRQRIIAESIAAAAQSLALEKVVTVAQAQAAQSAMAGQQMAAAQQMQAAQLLMGAQAAQAAQEAQQAALVSKAGRPYESVDPSQIEDVVDISEVWQSLEKSSRAWTLLIDRQAKIMTVDEFISRFRKQGVRIGKPGQFYAQMVEDLASQNPRMLEAPFQQIIQMLAVMEYDFDNGTDRDALARKVLGLQVYEQNKKRLGR